MGERDRAPRNRVDGLHLRDGIGQVAVDARRVRWIKGDDLDGLAHFRRAAVPPLAVEAHRRQGLAAARAPRDERGRWHGTSAVAMLHIRSLVVHSPPRLLSPNGSGRHQCSKRSNIIDKSVESVATPNRLLN